MMDHQILDLNYFRVNLFNGISIAYIDYATALAQDTKTKGTIVLIHGFPESSYQFRGVIPMLTAAGYRVVAPDYRGAGESSKPMEGFTKAVMAADVIMLLDHLELTDPVHVVGHDVGGMIAFALASRWPERVKSVCISEALLPGSDVCREQRYVNAVELFHYNFHCVANLPEAIITGREKIYIDYFLTHGSYRVGVFNNGVIDRYSKSLSQPGALRCALGLYRALEKDEDDTRDWTKDSGKCKVPCMMLTGEHSGYGEYAERMALELVQSSYVSTAVVPKASHFAAEENPAAFAEIVLAFAQKAAGKDPLTPIKAVN